MLFQGWVSIYRSFFLRWINCLFGGKEVPLRNLSLCWLWPLRSLTQSQEVIGVKGFLSTLVIIQSWLNALLHFWILDISAATHHVGRMFAVWKEHTFYMCRWQVLHSACFKLSRQAKVSFLMSTTHRPFNPTRECSYCGQFAALRSYLPVLQPCLNRGRTLAYVICDTLIHWYIHGHVRIIYFSYLIHCRD